MPGSAETPPGKPPFQAGQTPGKRSGGRGLSGFSRPSGKGAVAHVATIAIAAAVLFGVPFAAFANLDAMGAAVSGTDTVSAATAIQEAPSGRYTILVNRDKHADPDVLSNWVSFFSGDDTPLIMEDIDCVALAEDPGGVEMAKSLQSRLPENQMKLSVENAAMALSKADRGLFDALVMSDEAAEAYGAYTVEQAQDVEAIRR